MPDIKIDALLMDYALGAASEEVGALVQAYVARDAAARARLEQLRAMVGTARQVLAGTPTALPAFPKQAMERAARRAMWKRGALIGSAMAACVAAGVLVGWLWSPGTSGQKVIVRVVTQRPERMAPTEVATVRDFWSLQRLRATAQESQSDTPPVSVNRQRELALRHFFGGGL